MYRKGSQISLDLKDPVLPQNPKIRTLNQKFFQISSQIPTPKIIKIILLTLRRHTCAMKTIISLCLEHIK
jgi:hypothetical protein